MIVGISGATGIIYGLRLLEMLLELDIETLLVMTKAGERTLAYETDLKVREVRGAADYRYSDSEIGATIASGSFRTMGMVVAPCSVRSLSAMATGNTEPLVARRRRGEFAGCKLGFYGIRINSSLVGASSSPGTRTYADEAGEYSRQVTLVGETTCQSHLR
jgi:hypothetical protein